jgi:uncharacterized protein DUF3891
VLIREDSGGVLAIGQAAHAWVSGQLARAWGNERLGRLEPWEEVCLAAEQHDLGMIDYDLEPELNPETGHPRSFMEMPLETHIGIWEAAPRRMIIQSRYAALLVSMHGSALYERRNPDSMAALDAGLVREFLAGQEELQTGLIEALRADPATAPYTDDETLARNRRMIWTLDSLSLALLLDWAPFELVEVPAADGQVELRLERDLTLRPWPFREERLRVSCEGRRLTDRYDEEASMRAALERAPWETIELELSG